MTSSIVVDLLDALNRIDPALADNAVDTFLQWPKVYAPDAVLVSAALALGQSVAADAAAVKRLRAACMMHSRARISEDVNKL